MPTSLSKYKQGLELVKDELEQVGHAKAKAYKEREEAQALLDTKQAQLDNLTQMEADLIKDKEKLEKP